MDQISSFSRDVLYVIAGNPRIKGVSVAELIEEHYGKEIHNSRLYPVLTELAEDGLIEKGKQDDRTNSHTITPAGKEYLRTQRKWENKIADIHE